MAKKVPLWELLVDRGYFDDRKTAEGWVLAGKVIVGSDRIDKPGQAVREDVEVVVKGIEQKYVSKGGLKLEGALADFGVNVTGAVAIDAGASTGGFTDCLLQHGAAKVYAVDVGYGRLAGKIATDPRVVAMEKVNISDPTLLDLDPQPALATVDLSYLSLRKAIPIFADIMHGHGDLICLVKPLFEVENSSIRRTGKIDDPSIYRELLSDLAKFLDEQGYRLTGITHSHVTGNKGAREFFIMLGLDPDGERLARDQVGARIDRAVAAVLELKVFRK